MIPNSRINKKFKLPFDEVLNKRTKNDFEMVITRYDEDLSWCDNFDSFRTIYNKGPDDLNAKHIKRPNIGRDGETVFYHIVENWNNLANVTFFCQGAINDRNDQILTCKDIHNYVKCENGISYFKKRKDLPVYNEKFQNFQLEFGNLYDEIFKKKYVGNFFWVAGMWISVTKEVIKKVPLDIYKRILNLFDKYVCENDPTARVLACHCERFLLHVFTHL
jgi:hypothetical protein